MVDTGRADAAERDRPGAPVRVPTRLARPFLGLAVAALVAGCSGTTTSDTGTGEARPAPAAAETATDAADSTPLAAPAARAATDATEADEDEDAPRVGTLVEDFPVELLPVPEDAVLLVTSAVPVGESPVREVSLNLRTQMSVGAVMTLYRDVLTEAGFTEVTPPADESGPTADATFTRSGGDELVTIGVLDVDGGRTLTLGGRVRTADDGG
ncbi:hypothetical protein N866_03770 [Actinotalea ferrariae CF5-4]|uniref:Uncharacterized protein n=1 Tax=Actinotalea ferrariae CF5-4 TaxID=948458 RepID=A0A021VPF0_9CELL|nr:hypothetical protein [Actinotalea ferrariae]EYR62993.1 hypothetical protein N866_03770 [Actinotalea ferrariae CF5-4]